MGLDGVVLGHVLTKDEVKLQEGWRLANPADPEKEDGEVRIGDVDLSLRIILDEFFDVHKAELVHYLFFWCHWIS